MTLHRRRPARILFFVSAIFFPLTVAAQSAESLKHIKAVTGPYLNYAPYFIAQEEAVLRNRADQNIFSGSEPYAR